MVVGGHAGVAQLLRFLEAEFAECHADFHVERRHIAYDVEDLFKFLGSTAHAFPCGTHAETRRSIALGSKRVLHHLIALEQGLTLDVRLITRRL